MQQNTTASKIHNARERDDFDKKRKWDFYTKERQHKQQERDEKQNRTFPARFHDGTRVITQTKKKKKTERETEHAS